MDLTCKVPVDGVLPTQRIKLHNISSHYIAQQAFSWKKTFGHLRPEFHTRPQQFRSMMQRKEASPGHQMFLFLSGDTSIYIYIIYILYC